MKKEKSCKKAPKLLIAAVCAAMVGGGVYAYLASSDQAINRIPVGVDRTEIVERYDPPAKLEAGISFPKEVKISNTGKVPCYVRIKPLYTDEAALEYASVDYNTSDWVYDNSDGYWYYKYAVDPGGLTSPLFTTVTIDKNAAEDEIKDFDILVYHESYQKGTYDDYVTAWENYSKNQDAPFVVGLSLRPVDEYKNSGGRIIKAGSTINTDNLVCNAVYNTGHEALLSAGQYVLSTGNAPDDAGKFDITASYTDGENTYQSNPVEFEAIRLMSWENTANGTYAFTQSGSKWTSNNQGKHSTTATSTWTITVSEDTPYTFRYRVSSETNYDKLTIKLDDTTVANAISGNGSERTYSTTLSAGTHTITASYSKDSSANSNDDCGYIILEDIPY